MLDWTFDYGLLTLVVTLFEIKKRTHILSKTGFVQWLPSEFLCIFFFFFFARDLVDLFATRPSHTQDSFTL